ncbi:type II secretory pathway component PulJ [Rossellomorea marisflavi]
MFKKNDGFSFPEMLIAFSCLLLIIGVFLPLLLNQSVLLRDKQSEVEALKWMEEGVERAMVTNVYERSSKSYGGVDYTRYWEGEASSICVEMQRGRDFRKICSSVE